MQRLKIGLIFLLSFCLAQSLGHAQDKRGVDIVVKTKEGTTVSSYKDSYALVVGVSDYSNGWPDLPNTISDATKVKNSLEQQGFQVTLVTNPTHDQFKRALDDFIFNNGIFEDNRLLFYFAGHGYSMDMGYGGTTGYIVPSDAPIPQQNKASFMRKAISMREFDNQARQIQAKHVLYIFDSCFSGSIFALSRSIPDAISEKIMNPVRQFITAGSENEEVPDKSIFTDQLVSALSGEGDIIKDGYLTGSELGLFLQDKVEKYSNATQHPQYGKIRDPKLDKGDFVFVLKPDRPAPKSGIDRETNPPSIANLTDEKVEQGKSFAIRARVTDDNSGVRNVILAFKNSNSDAWNKVNMQPTSGDVYEYIISEDQIESPQIAYYFAAVDKAGNKKVLSETPNKSFTTEVEKKKSRKKWLWIIPPVAIIAGYLIYQQMPGTVDISVDIN
jgi:hypothetical protein